MSDMAAPYFLTQEEAFEAVHQGKKSCESHSCPCCGKKYSNRSNMVRHYCKKYLGMTHSSMAAVIAHLQAIPMWAPVPKIDNRDEAPNLVAVALHPPDIAVQSEANDIEFEKLRAFCESYKFIHFVFRSHHNCSSHYQLDDYGDCAICGKLCKLRNDYLIKLDESVREGALEGALSYMQKADALVDELIYAFPADWNLIYERLQLHFENR